MYTIMMPVKAAQLFLPSLFSYTCRFQEKRCEKTRDIKYL